MTTNVWRILQGDVCQKLMEIPEGSVQTCVTSPPYWGLRDYGHAGQLGLEPTPAEYVAAMVEVFAGVWRVLRDDGTLWLNLGDSYTSGGRSTRDPGKSKNHPALENWTGGRADTPPGMKPKDLVGIPWSVAFALRDAGWYLRSDIIWHKPNPMPESVTDRPTKSHEYLFLLTKSARYFYDAEAIKEQGKDWSSHKPGVGIKETHHYGAGNGGNGGLKGIAARYRGETCKDCGGGGKLGEERGGHPITCPTCNGRGKMLPPADRNRRSVWTVPTQAFPGAHFATYPEDLIEPCILAGTSERGQCPACGAPWARVVERSAMEVSTSAKGVLKHAQGLRTSTSGTMTKPPTSQTLGWQPSCDCNAGDPVPQLVLDPFTGSGTTGAVAIRHQRSFVGTELNPAYIELARKRIGSVAPMFARECGEELVDVLLASRTSRAGHAGNNQ